MPSLGLKGGHMKKASFVIILLMFLTALPVQAAQKLTLMLDWFPNVDHLPIYVRYFRGKCLKINPKRNSKITFLIIMNI